MSFSSFVARRYFRSRKKASAVGIITVVAAFGVAVSVFAMFVVLSVFSGLRALNVDYYTSFDPDISIFPARGKVFDADSVLRNKLSSVKGIQAVSSILEEKAFVSYGHSETIAMLRGVDADYPRVVDVDTVLVGGIWLPVEERPDTLWNVMGISLAYRLGMNVSSRPMPVRIYVPSGSDNISLSPEALFSYADTWPSGVFSHKDYDGTYLFTGIDFARGLLRRGKDQVSALEIKLDGKRFPDMVAGDIRRLLGDGFTVKTAVQNKEMYYKIMNTENLVLYFVFALVIAIALFNVIGSVVMLILDKRENIRTLWSLGADRKVLRSIFVREGMMIVGAGAAVGLLAAVILVWIQSEYHLVMIEGGMQVPYPVSLTFYNVVVVLFTIFALGYLAARLSVAGMKNFFAR